MADEVTGGGGSGGFTPVGGAGGMAEAGAAGASGGSGATAAGSPANPTSDAGGTPTSLIDPLRADPAVGSQTSTEYRSWPAILLGLYIFLLAFALVHVVVRVWPPPVLSRDVVDTLEREERARDERRIEAESVRARFVTPPAQSTAEEIITWRRDSTKAYAEAVEAGRWSEITRQLADSVRQRRARAVLDRTEVVLFRYLKLPDLSLDLRLILLALTMGALGAFVHAAQSFATYVGNRTLALSWSWWYVLRPLIGAALAGIFYFTIRGALFPNALTMSGDISPFGIAAIGSLAGMFSKQAVDKLNELFRSLFRTEAMAADDAARRARPADG